MTNPPLSPATDGTDAHTAISTQVRAIRRLTVDALYEAAMAEHASGDERSDWLSQVRAGLGEALARLEELAGLLQVEDATADRHRRDT